MTPALPLLMACFGPTEALFLDGPEPEPTGIVRDTFALGPDTDTGTPPPTPTGDTSTIPDTGSPLPTADTGPDPCLSAPPLPPKVWTTYTWVPPSEDFAFDDLGNVVNVDDVTDALFRTPFGGPPGLVVPVDAVEIAGFRILIGGDYAIADEWNGAILRYTSSGGSSTLATGLSSPNSMTVDEAGHLYATAYDQIVRIDPATGVQVPIHQVPWSDLDGLVFSPDFSTLYFNVDDTGEVSGIQILPGGTPGAVSTIATLPADWNDQLDGQAVDMCNNLYIVRTDGMLARIQPTGVVEFLADFGNVFTTSLNFGSGIGGWERDHLYIMDRDNGLIDFDIGIEGRPEPHLP